ncbi:MAG: hypothetical protein ACI8ZN_001936 [Bacteroidia bacterium]|jgi:hypothetical protein
MLGGIVRFIKKHKTVLLACLVLLTLAVNYQPFANDLPRGVHVWAQADRFALSLNYADELNFFIPRTESLMSDEGRVGTEFPLVQYASGQLSNFGMKGALPFIQRSLNLLIFLLGLLFLVKRIPGSTFQNAAIVFLSLASPIVVFYSFNFIPDAPGLGFAFIALGYFMKYTQTEHRRSMLLCIVFAAISTLIKTSCGLFFIAFAGTFGLQLLIKRSFKELWILIGVALLCTLAILSYDVIFFNGYNQKYFSYVFMSSAQPLQSFEDWSGFGNALQFWFGQYITFPQLGGGLVGLAFMIYLRKNLKFNNLLIWLTAVFGLGVFLLICLLGNQFVNHDYYFFVTIIPLFLLINLCIVQSFINQKKVIQAFTFIALVLGATSFVFASVEYPKRMNDTYVWKKRIIYNEVEWMRNGEEILTNKGISQKAIIFIAYEFGPNTALVYFGRKGKVFNHEEMTRDGKNMAYWLNRVQPEYFIVPGQWRSHLFRDQPQLQSQLFLFSKNDNFDIYRIKHEDGR